MYDLLCFIWVLWVLHKKQKQRLSRIEGADSNPAISSDPSSQPTGCELALTTAPGSNVSAVTESKLSSNKGADGGVIRDSKGNVLIAFYEYSASISWIEPCDMSSWIQRSCSKKHKVLLGVEIEFQAFWTYARTRCEA
ncbi:hypothetical protein Fot_40853 [Forsythia ovata]|uniref:RNase H type-1 domain-containing protein n=1 Tax=Forsythia ovata TaxID=205694 RepID=A0ABD1RHE1_9LAMI